MPGETGFRFTDPMLLDILIHGRIPFGMWGQGQAKTVQDLCEEIKRRESYLRIDHTGITRVTRIVRLRVQNPSLGSFMEVKQTLPDGRVRERHTHPGGKIIGNESPNNAAIRELFEEIGLKANLTKWMHIGTHKEENDSPSYPGLPSELEIHMFDFLVPDNCWLALKKEHETEEPDGTISHFRWEK